MEGVQLNWKKIFRISLKLNSFRDELSFNLNLVSFFICHVHRLSFRIYEMALPESSVYNHYIHCHNQGKELLIFLHFYICHKHTSKYLKGKKYNFFRSSALMAGRFEVPWAAIFVFSLFWKSLSIAIHRFADQIY